MFSIYVQNSSSIDDDHKEISLSKEIDFKIEGKTLDIWIFINTYSNELKFLSHIYSLMIYKTQSFKSKKSQTKEI